MVARRLGRVAFAAAHAFRAVECAGRGWGCVPAGRSPAGQAAPGVSQANARRRCLGWSLASLRLEATGGLRAHRRYVPGSRRRSSRCDSADTGSVLKVRGRCRWSPRIEADRSHSILGVVAVAAWAACLSGPRVRTVPGAESPASGRASRRRWLKPTTRPLLEPKSGVGALSPELRSRLFGCFVRREGVRPWAFGSYLLKACSRLPADAEGRDKLSWTHAAISAEEAARIQRIIGRSVARASGQRRTRCSAATDRCHPCARTRVSPMYPDRTLASQPRECPDPPSLKRVRMGQRSADALQGCLGKRDNLAVLNPSRRGEDIDGFQESWLWSRGSPGRGGYRLAHQVWAVDCTERRG